PIWAVVSAVVVILPEPHASVKSAALRVIANLVGASTGAALAAFHLPTTASLVVGLLLVAGLCRLLGIDAAARSASVALIIVSLRQSGGVWVSSETRVALVMLGCLTAFAVTLMAAFLERQLDHYLRRN